MSEPIYSNTLATLHRVAELIHLDKEILKQIEQPLKILEVNFPVKMDNGRVQMFKGYRVQHNNWLGPFKGGIRFHPNVSLDEVKSLAFWMSIKTAVADIPFGGGKGGVIVDPKQLSQNELENLSRTYFRFIADVVGPYKDVPAPDVNTNAKIMAWMRDEYEKIIGENAPAIVTGKPLEQSGSKGREEATGLGGAYLLENLVKKLAKDKSKITIAVQGIGNVGSFFAKFAQEFGYTIVALSDSKSAIYNANGIDVPKTLMYKKEKNSLSDYPDTKLITNEELLELDVDILVPAALENVINENNVKNIKAKVVLEMANGPTTPEADAFLQTQGIFVVPDVLANSGGVTVSYFEWFQNINQESWELQKVRDQLKSKIQKAWEEIEKKATILNCDFRTAAYAVAVEKIAEKAETK